MTASTPETDPSEHEVVVVGGGPAGLQAALTLGRVHRDTVLVDAGQGRNAPASHMHNLITRDGTDPEEFRRLAREELRSYPTVQVREGRVTSLRPAAGTAGEGGGTADLVELEGGGTAYLVELEDGTRLRTKGVILATGVRDELPDVPGLEELWGDLVAQCPFCHGHEFAGGRVAILGVEPATHLSGILRPVAAEIVVLTHGEEPPEDLPSFVPTVRTERVTGVARAGDGLEVQLASGPPVRVDGLFAPTTMHQAAPFAEQLGLGLNESGCTRVDESCRTSLPRVYAAGDMAHVEAIPLPMTSVAQAIASGMMAGATAVKELVEDEIG